MSSNGFEVARLLIDEIYGESVKRDEFLRKLTNEEADAASQGLDLVEAIESMHAQFGVVEAVKKMDVETLAAFVRFRMDFIQEELLEFYVAETPEERVDALIDLTVVSIGTLQALGVDVRKAWSTVHMANMKKEPGHNSSRKNEFRLPDLVKPEGWEPPDHSGNVGRFDEAHVALYREDDTFDPMEIENSESFDDAE